MPTNRPQKRLKMRKTAFSPHFKNRVLGRYPIVTATVKVGQAVFLPSAVLRIPGSRERVPPAFATGAATGNNALLLDHAGARTSGRNRRRCCQLQFVLLPTASISEAFAQLPPWSWHPGCCGRSGHHSRDAAPGLLFCLTNVEHRGCELPPAGLLPTQLSAPATASKKSISGHVQVSPKLYTSHRLASGVPVHPKKNKSPVSCFPASPPRQEIHTHLWWYCAPNRIRGQRATPPQPKVSPPPGATEECSRPTQSWVDFINPIYVTI